MHEQRHSRIVFTKLPGVRIGLSSIATPSTSILAHAMIQRINGAERHRVENVSALIPKPRNDTETNRLINIVDGCHTRPIQIRSNVGYYCSVDQF